MHPTIASFVIKAHAQDVTAAAAQHQLAKSVGQVPQDLEGAVSWSLRLLRSITPFRRNDTELATA